MSAAPFLMGLAVRGAATATAALRPDPWRGRDEPAADAPAEQATPAPPPPATGPITAEPTLPTMPAAPSAPMSPRAVLPTAAPRQPETQSPTIRETIRIVAENRPTAPPPAVAEWPIPREGAAETPPVTAILRESAAAPATAPTLAPRTVEASPAPFRPPPPLPVQPRLRPSEPRPGEPDEEPHTIEISIGRIEWRAPPQQPAPRSSPSPASPAGFAAFAALRAGLDRGRR